VFLYCTVLLCCFYRITWWWWYPNLAPWGEIWQGRVNCRLYHTQLQPKTSKRPL